MKRKLVVAAIVIAVFVALVVISIYEPTRIMRGLALREAFFNGRPTSYWRDIIRVDGAAGKLADETVDAFDDPSAIPVLRECLADPDPNVRWPTVYLINEAGFIRDIEPAARRALDDPNIDVKLAGLRVVRRLGREASSTIPKLVDLTSDDDLNIVAAAHYALWEIDTEEALKAGRWQELQSTKYQFSVVMPGTPEKDEASVQTPYGEAPLHRFSVSFGFARCIVGVSEYSEQVLSDFSVEDRYDSAAEVTADALGGTLARHEPIEQHGQIGRDQLIEVEGKANMHTRVFLIGTRSYQANITYPPGTVSPKAVAHYLDSLRIEFVPEPIAEEVTGGDAP